MATRFYFNEIVTSLTPAFSSEWERVETSPTPRKLITTERLGAAFVSIYWVENSATSPYDTHYRQLITEPLKSQTISGTVCGQIRVLQSSSAAESCRALVIRAWDGSSYRGTLLSHFPASLISEFPFPTYQNRYFPPPDTALSSLDVEYGDRLVIEIGVRGFTPTTDYYGAYVRCGSASGTDLPQDETDTNDYNPWIEFSQDLIFTDIRVVPGITPT